MSKKKEGFISFEEAIKKQKAIIKRKINKNFEETIKKNIEKGLNEANAFIQSLKDIWINPKTKQDKWNADTFKFRKGKLKKELVD